MARCFGERVVRLLHVLGLPFERLFAPGFARLPPSCDISCAGECDRRLSSDFARPCWPNWAAQTLLGSILDAKIVCFPLFFVTLTRLFTISLKVDRTL